MPSVSLPRILQPATQSLAFDVAGDTLRASVENLLEREPNLKVHLFDETGSLRPHVLCFVDGESTRLEDQDQPVSPDSTIAFVQAVSGG